MTTKPTPQNSGNRDVGNSKDIISNDTQKRSDSNLANVDRNALRLKTIQQSHAQQLSTESLKFSANSGHSELYVHADFDFVPVVYESWLQVLKLDTVDVNVGFFESGGSSLQAALLFTILSKKIPDMEIRLFDIFTYPTINEFADYLCSKFKG